MTIVLKDRGSGYFNSYILRRIEQNKNFVAVITGSTGSGKSYSALKFGEALDPEFDVRNICFTSKEFMDLINGKTKQLKKGSFILYDEIQVSMSHLEYQSLQARILNYTFQTFRHRNFILFMTSPHFSFINASLRKLFHARMETLSIDFSKRLTTIKPMLIQCNQRTGDIYEKFLRVYDKKHGLVPIRKIKVPLPSAELLKVYEEKKNAFTKELNQSISKDIERMENHDKIQSKPLTDKQNEIIEDLMLGLTVPQIAKKQSIVEDSVRFHMRQIEKKGVEINPIREGLTIKRYEIAQNS